jgi:hypothetical protein
MEPAEVAAVVEHMNDAHLDDSLLICRMLGGEPDADAARMLDLDATHGTFVATVDGAERPVRVAWESPVVERQDARAQIVALYRAACAQAGIEPRGEG